MKRVANIALRWYTKLVLDHPVWVILVLGILICFLGYKAREFRIDASAESILLENDKDLRYSRNITDRYGVNDIIAIAYTPKDGDLFSETTMAELGRLRDELKILPQTVSVTTLLDVPLFESPPMSYAELSQGIRTLESPQTDRSLAAKELKNSPFYRDLIVSEDVKTTTVLVNLKIDSLYQALLHERNGYLDKRADGQLTDADADALKGVQAKIGRHMQTLSVTQHENIKNVRAIMDKYRSHADLFLGGVTMVQDDMISFVRNDLKLFGVGVFLMLVIMLGIFFKRVLWVVLPMLCCFLSVVAMMGILSIFGWEVTIISSNFISLQLIMTLAVTIHLIVRYREYHRDNLEENQRTLVHRTIHTKFVPCVYATLTTIAGFSSLVFCDIKPVINFGWMMSVGLVVSLILTFILFPATVMLVKKRELMAEAPSRATYSLTAFLGRITQSHGMLILAISGVIAILATMGILRLRVENSFIDYFKKSTEIYQGMHLIDQKLGGTTPLDVIVQFEPVNLKQFAQSDEEEEDPFDVYGPKTAEDYDKYWFFDDRLKTIRKVHDYLESLPETGKVISLDTLLKIGRTLNDNKPIQSIEMAVIYAKLPDEYRDLILNPYISVKHSEARFWVRIKDSQKNLHRDALLKRIKHDLTAKLHLPAERVHLTGAMVLYNNMLQSLFSSQIKTMGFVALALLGMFLILFRSLKLSFIALFPNLLATGSVISVMGWLNIPLDMMTITIAAISMGIAVDDTIHYIYRFKEEVKKDGDYYQALHRCHASIGHAMYYTSVAIIIGFSILAFSSFWPTIYFGLFTGLAMFAALIAALTLLPQLIVVVKPFGPDKASV